MLPAARYENVQSPLLLLAGLPEELPDELPVELLDELSDELLLGVLLGVELVVAEADGADVGAAVDGSELVLDG